MLRLCDRLNGLHRLCNFLVWYHVVIPLSCFIRCCIQIMFLFLRLKCWLFKMIIIVLLFVFQIEQDNIIPKQWLKDICWIQWKTMLESENSAILNSPPSTSSNAATAVSGANLQGQLVPPHSSYNLSSSSASSNSRCVSNRGPVGSFLNTSGGGSTSGPNPPSVVASVFNKYSMRCGRILDIPNNDYCWRWTGFNYGIDLLMLFSNNQLMIKRNVNTHPTTQRLNQASLNFSSLKFDFFCASKL